MNRTQTALIDILSSSIRGHKAERTQFKSKAEMEAVLKEATAHDVHSLLYPALNGISMDMEGWENFLSSLKIISMTIASRQMKFNHGASKVLNELKKAGITVVALKGIVLKELYPYPDLRTMGDVDLLIPMNQIALGKNVLNSLGYKEMSSDPKHAAFVHQSAPPIEIHWTLLNKERHKNKEALFEKYIWDHITSANVCGIEVNSIGDNGQLLHICLHMMSHILSRGFGLRQFCDLVMFTENRFDNIDWQEFSAQCRDLEVEQFVAAIFLAANQLFGLKIPAYILEQKIKQKVIDNLISDMFKSGTFGHRTTDWEYSRKVMDVINKNRTQFSISPRKLSKIIAMRTQQIKETYPYARRHRLFIPFAWGHYIAAKICNLIVSLAAAKRRTKLFISLGLK